MYNDMTITIFDQVRRVARSYKGGSWDSATSTDQGLSLIDESLKISPAAVLVRNRELAPEQPGIEILGGQWALLGNIPDIEFDFPRNTSNPNAVQITR